MCRELNDLMLGSILTDMHGKAFNFAPDLPGIVWTNWIAFRSKTFRMPAIKYKGRTVIKSIDGKIEVTP